MQRPQSVPAHQRCFCSTRPPPRPLRINVHKRFQFRLHLRRSLQMRLYNLNRRKLLLANPRGNFRNRPKNYFAHSLAFEPMCPPLPRSSRMETPTLAR